MGLTAAERQRKRRELLKERGLFGHYQTVNAGYSKAYRQREKENLKNLTSEEKCRLLNEKRQRDRARQNKCREKKRVSKLTTPACASSPQPYSRLSSLSRATNKVMRALPNSPRKKKAVFRKLALQFPNDKPPVSRRMDSLTDETCSLVRNFYSRDDISRMAPGKRDVVTVRSPEGKVKLQKRHLFMSIKETYSTFKEEHPDVKIGVSKFAELRPLNVLLSCQTPSNTCLCLYHQNFILAIEAITKYIPEIPSYSKDFPSTCLEDVDNLKCWFSECDHEKCGFDQIYELPDDVEILQFGVKWIQWQDVDGRILKRENCGTVKDLYDHIAAMAPKFLKHCFIKRNQAQQYEADKAEALKPDSVTAVLQMDFAENFTCCAQDEVQSAHWNQTQVTLYTSVVWFRGQTFSHVIISDYMKHDKTAVTVFTDEILSGLEEGVLEVRVWTDGPASQFKNRFVMSAIQPLANRHGKKLTWNFSATSHGKGPVDGIGASLKRNATDGIKARKFIINGAQDFYERVKTVSVKTTMITSDSVTERASALGLDGILGEAKSIPGISQFHYFEPTDIDINTKRYTCELVDFHLQESDQYRPTASENDTSKPDYETGNIVALKISGKRAQVAYIYMAQILELDNNEVRLRYLRREGTLYQWLSEKEDTWQPINDILCQMPYPDLVNNREQLSFPEPSLQKVKDAVTGLPSIITVHWK